VGNILKKLSPDDVLYKKRRDIKRKEKGKTHIFYFTNH
jgi:hypothetical protein